MLTERVEKFSDLLEDALCDRLDLKTYEFHKICIRQFSCTTERVLLRNKHSTWLVESSEVAMFSTGAMDLSVILQLKFDSLGMRNNDPVRGQWKVLDCYLIRWIYLLQLRVVLDDVCWCPGEQWERLAAACVLFQPPPVPSPWSQPILWHEAELL